jgi:cyanophycin synthetase
MTAELVIESPVRAPRPTSFRDWRARLDRDHIAPVIAIAGSRGKTSVLRAVESVLLAAGLRFATWTDQGVEIEGERQRGELGPWSRAITRLGAGGLDIALQELDWATIQALGAPDGAYPIVAVANLCANNEACLITTETVLAMRALARIRRSASPTGRLILNAEDFAVADDTASEDSADRYLVGMSPDTPVLRRHLTLGGDACWVSGSTIVTQEDSVPTDVVDVHGLHWAQDGAIPFSIQNALMATAIARGCGLSHQLIATGLANHQARPETMPGSFNVFDTGSATVVVDRPMAPWFLRPVVRAAANLGPGHHMRVIGPMPDIATEDLIEVGRLLGRNGGAMVAHGHWDEDRLALLRRGAAVNEVPPIFMQAVDERAAVQQALGMLRAGDVLLILAEDAAATVRLVARRLGRAGGTRHPTFGAA